MTRRSPLLALVALLAVAATGLGTITFATATRPFDDDRYTVLVMGSDQGPWRSGNVLGGRSDALHLVSVVPGQGKVSILSFPRDSYVSVPGMGSTRINAALTRGPDTAVATMENLVGVEIDDWIVTGMQAFHQGVDAFGGIEVDVPQRLSLDGRTIDPGKQRLNGPDALLYARDRKNRSDGDFGRNRAQAEVLALLHRELVQKDPSPIELAGFVRDLRRSTVSSISPARMLVLAGAALEISPGDVVRKQVPGSNASRGGAAVVVLGGGAETLFADLRDDGVLQP